MIVWDFIHIFPIFYLSNFNVKIIPLSLDFDIGFIHSLAVTDRIFLFSKCVLQHLCILDDPALDRRMIDIDASFDHQFFDISVTKSVPQIPTDGLQNDTFGKVAAFKTVLTHPGSRQNWNIYQIDCGVANFATEPHNLV
jgi:hypothetical protein